MLVIVMVEQKVAKLVMLRVMSTFQTDQGTADGWIFCLRLVQQGHKSCCSIQQTLNILEGSFKSPMC